MSFNAKKIIVHTAKLRIVLSQTQTIYNNHNIKIFFTCKLHTGVCRHVWKRLPKLQLFNEVRRAASSPHAHIFIGASPEFAGYDDDDDMVDKVTVVTIPVIQYPQTGPESVLPKKLTNQPN